MVLRMRDIGSPWDGPLLLFVSCNSVSADRKSYFPCSVWLMSVASRDSVSPRRRWPLCGLFYTTPFVAAKSAESSSTQPQSLKQKRILDSANRHQLTDSDVKTTKKSLERPRQKLERSSKNHQRVSIDP